jgi:hypothetical protein
MQDQLYDDACKIWDSEYEEAREFQKDLTSSEIAVIVPEILASSVGNIPQNQEFISVVLAGLKTLISCDTELSNSTIRKWNSEHLPILVKEVYIKMWDDLALNQTLQNFPGDLSPATKVDLTVHLWDRLLVFQFI